MRPLGAFEVVLLYYTGAMTEEGRTRFEEVKRAGLRLEQLRSRFRQGKV
jgi:hypothetical protein